MSSAHKCLVCERDAEVYCKNDDAYLCHVCDQHIHSANALAQRHTRVPLAGVNVISSMDLEAFTPEMADGLTGADVSDFQVPDIDDLGAANLISDDFNAVFHDDPFFIVPDAFADAHGKGSKADNKLMLSKTAGMSQDIEMFGMGLDDSWLEEGADLERVSSDLLDSLVPIAKPKQEVSAPATPYPAPAEPVQMAAPGLSVPAYAPTPVQARVPATAVAPRAPRVTLDCSVAPASVASSDYGVDIASYVPRTLVPVDATQAAQRLAERRERVQRFFEKKRNRHFKKTIRYASRKAYAEVRPRIKGRFARKDEVAAMRAAGLLPAVA